MNISHNVYTNISAAERVRAAVSALARGDERELEKLTETCPKRVMSITDPDYSERIPLLMSVLLVMDFDIMSDVIDLLIARKEGLGSDTIQSIIARMATTHVALKNLADAEGIDLVELEGCGPPRHPYVARLLEFIEGEGDDHEAAEIATGLLKFVRQDS